MSNPKPILHFIPGEIVFRVDHEYSEAENDKVISRLQTRYDGYGGGIEFDENRIVTFDRGPLGCLYLLRILLWRIFQFIVWLLTGDTIPRLPDWLPTRYFSLVFAEVPDSGFDPSSPDAWFHIEPSNLEHLVTRVRQLDADSGWHTYHVSRDEMTSAAAQAVSTQVSIYKGEASRQGIEAGHSFGDDLLHHLKPPRILEVKAVTFNWLGGAAPGGLIPTGGPGAQPRPDGTLSTSTSVPGLKIIGLTDSIPSPAPAITGPDIKIMVLDTRPQIPTDNLLDCFLPNQVPDTPLIRWWNKISVQAVGQNHFLKHRNNTPIGKNLAGRASNLTPPVRASSLDELMSDNDAGIGIQGHDYDMSPHGTFAADVLYGIVEAVPGLNLEFQVIEVLNKWGVGSMETVVRGLKEVYEESKRSTTPIIANCSFTFQIPRLNAGAASHLVSVGPREGKFKADFEEFLSNNRIEEHIMSVIQPVFDLLHNKDVWIVAAAGNDGAAGKTRPVARYPAANKKVIGVSALSVRGENVIDPASYSDAADEPENNGFAVYGGDVDPNNPTMTDPEKGMLGLYYTDIPDASGKPSTHPSKTGYLALWAGTSFAAPVITGILTVMRAQGMTYGQAIEALQELGNRTQIDGTKEFVVWVE